MQSESKLIRIDFGKGEEVSASVLRQYESDGWAIDALRLLRGDDDGSFMVVRLVRKDCLPARTIAV